jgi:hypothetical protein
VNGRKPATRNIDVGLVIALRLTVFANEHAK